MPAANSQAGDEPAPAYAVTSEQVRERAFLGWCALIDADKYLRWGSRWEARSRLHEARHHIWALWAAATGSRTHGTACRRCSTTTRETCRRASQSTVARLDTADLRRATRASAALLSKVSASAAHQHPADLPSAMADYVTHALSRDR